MSITLALGLTLSVGAGPADGGWYYWEPSPCRGDVEWKATVSGVSYWVWGHSERYGAHLVPNGYFLNTYAGFGYECGFLGPPLTNVQCNSTFCWQDYEGGRLSTRR